MEMKAVKRDASTKIKMNCKVKSTVYLENISQHFSMMSSVERLFFRSQFRMLAFCHFTVKFNSRVQFVPYHLRYAAASYVFYHTCYLSWLTTMLSILCIVSRDQSAGRQRKREKEAFRLCMILSTFIPFNSFIISIFLKKSNDDPKNGMFILIWFNCNDTRNIEHLMFSFQSFIPNFLQQYNSSVIVPVISPRRPFLAHLASMLAITPEKEKILPPIKSAFLLLSQG